MDDEVLEMGEDGAFEIVSTKPVKQVPIIQPSYEVNYESQDEAGGSTQDLLDSLMVGDYKIYKAAGHLHIIVRVPADESVLSVGLESGSVQIRTESGKTHCVSLSNVPNIDSNDGCCSIWKDYVSIKFAIAK